MSEPDIPRQIGPVAFSQLGRMMRRAGGTWDPGNHLWLIHVRRMGPVIRTLRRVTDPLFRQAGLNLDER
jgi:hypothetical protein